MKNYWINVSNRIKQSEKLRFNYIMDKIETGESGDQTQIDALDARIRALEDINGYTVVITEKNGVTGATVKIGADITCTDNNDGTYTANNVKPGTYTITATKSDYSNFSKADVSIDYQHLTQEITMVKAPHTVSGTVKDDAGEPAAIENATVNILDGETIIGTATTNASGEYSISDIISGTYTIQAVKEGYSHTAEEITVNADDLTKNITMITDST